MTLFRLAAVVLACLMAEPGSAETLRGVVVGVSDGDTPTLLTANNRSIRLRLAEIAAPELHGQPFGRAAKMALSSLGGIGDPLAIAWSSAWLLRPEPEARLQSALSMLETCCLRAFSSPT